MRAEQPACLPSSVLEPTTVPLAVEPVARAKWNVSPYPWSYTLVWPWYFRYPSFANPTGLIASPTSFRGVAAHGQPTLKLCAVGDIMVMQGDRIPVLAPPLKALFAGADLIVGGCEAPIGRSDCDPNAEHHFVFNMPRDYLRGIIEQSGAPPERWYLTVANNHAGDIGPDGLSSTVRHLAALGAHPVGARVAGQPPFTLAEVGGLRLGIASWTQWQNFHEPRVYETRDVESIRWPEMRKSFGLDGLLSLCHWGHEWQHFPRAQTRELARMLARGGFDVLVGAHPHTLQPFEWIGETLCAHSLGNFCSGLGVSSAARMCNVLTLELGTRGAQRGKVLGYELHAFAQVDDGRCVTLVPIAEAPAVLQRYHAKVATRCFRASAPHERRDAIYAPTKGTKFTPSSTSRS